MRPDDYLPCNFEELQNLLQYVAPASLGAVTFVAGSGLLDAIDQRPL
jgi:hypothetical protein